MTMELPILVYRQYMELPAAMLSNGNYNRMWNVDYHIKYLS